MSGPHQGDISTCSAPVPYTRVFYTNTSESTFRDDIRVSILGQMQKKRGGATEGGGALESMGVPLVSAKAERLELPGGARWERRLRCVDRRAAGLLRLTLTHMRRSVWTGGQWACSGSHSLT